MLKSRAVFAVVMVALLPGSVGSCRGGDGSPEQWLADFEKLKVEMATGYANLDWSAHRHGIDLAVLARDTEAALSRTTSRKKARGIIEAFIETFEDPHLRAEHAKPPATTPESSGEWVGPSSTESTKKALAALGYRKGKYDFGVDVESLDGFERFADGENPFPAGVLPLEDGSIVGIIRIKYFGEDRYYEVAARTWEVLRGEFDGPCDSACWWKFTLQVRTRLMESLEARLEEIESAGAGAIVVDITGNGGGSEWCEDVARMFTTTTLHAPPVGFVKHVHWRREIEREITRLEEDLARDELPREIRAMLAETLTDREQLLDEIDAGCSPGEIWGDAPHDCNPLAFYENERVAVPAGVDSLAATLASKSILFRSPRHPEFLGRYDGPLVVVIDGGTASASEQFATLLQYNGAATIVGESSYGAGCGYTRGGIRLYLEHVELRVWMPDCLRLRADGENELLGVDPDMPGWEPGAKGKTRARALLDVLTGVAGDGTLSR